MQVKKALNSRRNFELTAVKIVDRIRAPRDYQDKFLPRELALWPRLCHPNLIRFIEYFEDNQRAYMVMTLCTQSAIFPMDTSKGLLFVTTSDWYTDLLVFIVANPGLIQ